MHSDSAAFPPPCAFDPLSGLKTIEKEADWIGLRFVEEKQQQRLARNGKMDRHALSIDCGVMIEALVEGQIGYAATSDLSEGGLRRAAEIARELATNTKAQRVFSLSQAHRPSHREKVTASGIPFEKDPFLLDLTDHLVKASQALKVDERIVTTRSEATLTETQTHYVSTSGTDLFQSKRLIAQNFVASARRGTDIQHRSLNGQTARCSQAGLEGFDWAHLLEECRKTGFEALALLKAPDCPTDTRDLILAPDQMLLQIHESIGHPLELDRILGDERNYAGWSFVKPEDFGTLQYGSDLMNISFDPDFPGEFASYAFDDSGAPARKLFLIEKGRLVRGLGGLESQSRLKVPGVSNFRAASWNRAPIDRMANINLEAGDSSLDQMIESVERGILMESNRSWSIDDYRNKFQFGCEIGRLIQDGQLGPIVKNPNYRGVSVPFWRSLAAVGNRASVGAFGTPYCGKGEPNQMIRVGHASPPCLFRSVEVFGGAPA